MRYTLREKIKQNFSVPFILFFYFFGSLAFLFYRYLPFKVMGIALITGITCAAFIVLFTEKKIGHFAYGITLLLSALALYHHWQWGFTVIGFHLESYYCWIVLSVSAITYPIRLLLGFKRSK